MTRKTAATIFAVLVLAMTVLAGIATCHQIMPRGGVEVYLPESKEGNK